MGATSIAWCDFTFNHIRGCTKVSAGCEHCYADTLSKRNPGTLGVWGPNGTRVVAADSYWRLPEKWNREAAAAGERRRVFCASLADVFEDWRGPMVNSAGDELWGNNDGAWKSLSKQEHGRILFKVEMSHARHRLFRMFADLDNLDLLLLTKRPENVLRMVPAEWLTNWPAHVWLGTSVENQATADERIPHLLRVPAAVRFLSMEPLLGPVDLRQPLDHPQRTWLQVLDWVIVGGESGPGARPCDIDWVRSIRDQCQAAGVPVFVKQLGAVIEATNAIDPIDQFPDVKSFSQGRDYFTVLVTLRCKKGSDPSEWPADLRVRQFPTPTTASGVPA